VFDLDQFIAELRNALAERSRAAMKDVVAHAVREPPALLRALGDPKKPGVHVLHRSPELTVLNAIWAPLQFASPHEHRLTAVIGMYGGREDNMFWRRTPRGSGAQIELAGGQALATGDTALLGPDIVHSVINPLGRLSGAIHVYDGDFFGIERSMWEPETLSSKACRRRAQTSVLPILHTIGDVTVAEFVADGILLRNTDDARDLLMQSQRAEWIAVHEKNITPEFFDLRTGVAGDVLQKLVNYQTKFAVIGDISRYTEKSEALAALIRESNRGRDIRFADTMEKLLAAI
jgi:predicted metal-dependent enzyme (double-stranded beta helix superfamily)